MQLYISQSINVIPVCTMANVFFSVKSIGYLVLLMHHSFSDTLHFLKLYLVKWYIICLFVWV